MLLALRNSEKLFDAGKCRILCAAPNPQQLQLLVRFVGIRRDLRVGLRKVRGVAQPGAEAADVAEERDVVEADAQRLPTAHRQPDDGAAIAIGVRAVVRLDVGNDILDEVFAELRRVLRLRSVRRHAVSERHDDDERLDFAGGEQVVEDEIRPAEPIPRVLVGVGAVEQIQHRISRRSILVVARRRIHREPPHAVERLRVIPMRADVAVRHRLRVVERGRWVPDFQHARNRARRRAGLQLRIRRIDGPDAVDREVVVIHLGSDRTDRHAPHAVGIPGEACRLVEKFTGEHHLVRFRRVQAKCHAAVRQHVWRDNGPRLLRVRRQRGQRDDQNAQRRWFASWFDWWWRGRSYRRQKSDACRRRHVGKNSGRLQPAVRVVDSRREHLVRFGQRDGHVAA